MNKDLLPYWINEVERKISTAPVGPVLVTGGPGTGKTRALAYRVAGLVRGDVPPEKIFLLTTNRSLVREMQQGLLRFSEEFHRFVPIEKIRRVRTGTLDILAGDFLLRNRAHIEEGIPDKPRIRQEYTATFFMALYNYEQLTEMGVSTNELEDILHWNTLLRSGYPQDPEIRIPPLWHKVLDVYECYKRDKGVLDSLDLLSKAIETMQRNPDLVDAFHKPSEVHVLVDDFHNVSRAGYKFLQMISRQSGSITVAGDSNCAVGPWPVFGDKLLDRFKAEYPQVQHFQLRFNRRSTPLLGKLASVLATQATMDPMVDQAGQDAFVSCNSGGEMAQLVKVDGDRETMHGRLVDDIIVKKQSGIPFEQMAVIRRRHPREHASDTLLKLLNSRVIPYTKIALNDVGVDKGESQGITLATAHASQGRPWSHVWVVDAADRIMPGRLSLLNTNISMMERRLFFIVATRATFSLQFWYCTDHRGDRPSRFIPTG